MDEEDEVSKFNPQKSMKRLEKAREFFTDIRDYTENEILYLKALYSCASSKKILDQKMKKSSEHKKLIQEANQLFKKLKEE